MKRFLTQLGLILSTSLLISFVIAGIFERYFLEDNESHMAYKLNRFYSFSDDVLFMGSSRAQQSFLVDSMFTSDHSYNYGLVGTGNWLWPRLLVDAINNDKQELIFINVDPPSLDHGSLWNSSYYLKIPRSSFLFNSLSRSDQRSIGYFPFKFFGRYIELFRTGIKRWYNITSYEYKGTSISVKTPNAEMFGASSFTKDAALICDEAKITFLKTHLSHNEDIIVFLKLPSYNESGKESFFKDFKPQLKELPNIFFMDYTGTFQDRKYWYDHVHFNLEGANVFSQQLREDLKAKVDSGTMKLPENIVFFKGH